MYDLFGLAPRHTTHGSSLLPLLDGSATRVREWALSGVYGRWVHVLDGSRKYARGPVDETNLPLSMWSNRWSTMPVHVMPQLKLPRPDRRARIDFMPGSDVPVLRQPFQPGDMLPYWCAGQKANWHCLYNLDNDPQETENRLGGSEERMMLDLLNTALEELEAPRDQFQRLGIA